MEEGVCGGAGGQLRVSFVSDQLAPQILAMHEFSGQIDVCLLLATSSMAGNASQLKAELLRIAEGRRTRVEVKVVKLEQDATAVSEQLTDTIEQQARKLLQAYPDSHLVFDLTGGTKLMAIALYMVAGKLQAEGVAARVCYTNTDADAFQWLWPSLQSQPMQVRLGVRQLLAANRHEVSAAASEDWAYLDALRERAVLTETVMAQCSAENISCLNMWASAAEKKLKGQGTRPQGRVQVVREAEKLPPLPAPLLAQLQAAGAIECHNGSKGLEAITFNGASWVRYLNGIWLEEWAWLQLSRIEGLDHVELSVEIGRGEAANELDLVLAHRNRLLVMEVKTINWKGERQAAKAADILYKIDSLSQKVARLFGTPLLLSWGELSEPAAKRARDARITVLECKGGDSAALARQLRATVEKWMQQGKLPRAVA